MCLCCKYAQTQVDNFPQISEQKQHNIAFQSHNMFYFLTMQLQK